MYYVIFSLLGAALLCADQWVKAWTVAHLELWETAPLFPGFLELMRVHNYGAAWSSFSGQRWLLLGVTGVIVLAVLWALIRKIVRHPLGILACCLIISGGIGNIIDRLRLGYVVDMLHFQFWLSYPTFNVADICIVCGAILGAVYYVLIYEKHDGRKQNGATDLQADSEDAGKRLDAWLAEQTELTRSAARGCWRRAGSRRRESPWRKIPA